ncbi:MAG: 4-alpha-glucanotransferase [Bryobacterales bacterium]|nr:4-alpha-glucanotransferase [Bryobacteraceae bacterium]MDW8353391.1 4-alpha-glucanotransferase [Bryobacterales bacterium]
MAFHITFVPSATEEEALTRAAAFFGVQLEYWDVRGVRHVAEPDVLRAILQAMGVDCSSRETLDAAVEGALWQEWSQLLPPVLVLDEAARELPLNVPQEAEHAAITIRWEGEGQEHWVVPTAGLPESGSAFLRGQLFCRKRTPLPPLRLGYHSIQVEVGGAVASSPLIVCPQRAWLPPELLAGGRMAGIAISLFGLRSARNWGCGDFTDLERFLDWAADDAGVSFVALNPLHAIHNRTPFNTSPYLPNSVFFRNPLYVDVERIEEFQRSRRARSLFASPEVQDEIRNLRAAPLVEYERVWALKRRFLEIAYETFLEDATPSRHEAFEHYCAQQGELLEQFAVYCALDEWIRAHNPGIWVWPEWPEAYRHPDSDAVRTFARERRRDVLFHKYVQWQLEQQLAAAQQYARHKGMRIGLYHDLALATDRCGADVWARRPFFAEGCRVGAPPDDFSPGGQDWGFPPPQARHHRRTAYRLFVESIRRNCAHGGALRVDHVMRFFRLFWIPDGMEAARGAYVRDFHEDLLRILALESVRNRVVIIGEDLGTVEPWIRTEMERFGILGYRVLWFEKNSDGEFRPPEQYPRQALVAATTHDLPTLAGFWLGRDIEARRAAGRLTDAQYREALRGRCLDKQRLLDLLFRLGLLPDFVPHDAAAIAELTGELHNAIVGFLATTPSMLMLVNQEDLTKETEQQNVPGTTGEYPNWRHKMRFTVEELRSLPEARAVTAMLRHWLERTGRRNWS